MSCDQQHKAWATKAWIASALLLLTIMALMAAWMPGCGVKQKAASDPPPTTADDGGEDGDEGDGGDGTVTPPPGGQPSCEQVTTFDELSPVIALNCVGCHTGYDTYDVAKQRIDTMITRIKIPAGQASHMPAGRGDLSSGEIGLFESWKANGLLKAGECATAGTGSLPPPTNFRAFAEVEQTMFAAVNSVAAVDKPNVRFLLGVDRINQGKADELKIAKDAANKATNSVSDERAIYPVVAVGPGIWQIDIDELGISAADWTAIEDASQLQFESQTGTGIALKQVTQSRLPWMFVDDFIDVALKNATIYYQLTDAPATLQQLQTNLGVDFAGDLADFKAALVGFNGSALSPAANRLMSRHDSNDGFYWGTYDTGPIVAAAQNLFTNPLLAEAGGVANLQFAAGEQLYSLPNGLIGSFLALADGTRIDFADPAVVHDFTANPVAPFIRNSLSCFRCHASGILAATDAVRESVSGPGTQVGAADVQRAIALYKPQPEINSLIAEDNVQFTDALKQLGIDPSAPDPITRISDRFLGDWKLEDLAAKLFLLPADMRICLNLSQAGRVQAGQLLAGNTVAHDQLVQVIKDIVTDCRIFQDPLN